MVLGISNQSRTILQNFIRDQGITFPVLQDDQAVYSRYNLPGGQSPYPRDFIIKDGQIHFADTEYDPGAMIKVIEALLAEETTGVFPNGTTLPADFAISSAFPNPFNPVITLGVTIPQGQPAELEIYDISGRWVDTLFSGWLAAGPHQFRWDGKGAGETDLPSGVYLVALKGEHSLATLKIALLK
jgi:hypothetical protein